MLLIIADNQDITRYGLTYLVNKDALYSTIKEVYTKEELVQILQFNPNSVIVLDYTLFHISPEQLIILQERFKETHWILFSETLSEDFIRRMAFSGTAFSIVLKDSKVEEVKLALELALKKEQYVCQQLSSWLFQKEPQNKKNISPLTTTEKEILKLIALGKTTKEIASIRVSSFHTIMTHRKNIFRKLEVNNIHEATKYALKAGIIDTIEYSI